MNKLIELRRAKMLALSLLLIAAATFVVTLFLPPNFWVSGVKAIAEAAMVGALADWFAVVALFRRVPIPIISRHTAIIPRNKDRIGENLGQFVQEKFLDTQSLVALIRRHEPALLIGNWFSQPENARRVGQHLLQIMSGFLELTDDARIQRLLKRAVHRAIDKVDLSGTSALMLESMTKNDRHQVLLDTLIAQLIALLQRDKSRKFIAQQIVRWLESEHPLKAKILPTEWLGEHSARSALRVRSSQIHRFWHCIDSISCVSEPCRVPAHKYNRKPDSRLCSSGIVPARSHLRLKKRSYPKQPDKPPD